MTAFLHGRRTSLRQKGPAVTGTSEGSQPRSPRSPKSPRGPLNLDKPLPPRPISFSSSIYSEDNDSSCAHLGQWRVDLITRQNQYRQGMDVSSIAPSARHDCVCGRVEEEDEDSGDSSSPESPVTVTDGDLGLPLPVYSAFSSAFSSTTSLACEPPPKSPRRNADLQEKQNDALKKEANLSRETIIIEDQSTDDSDTLHSTDQADWAPGALGIQGAPAPLPRPTLSLTTGRSHSYSSRSGQRSPAPPPLKLYERALCETYVKSPSPVSPARNNTLSAPEQRSVFEDGDDDEEDDDISPGAGRRRNHSIHSAFHRGEGSSAKRDKSPRFTGLGDLTHSLRGRSARRASLQYPQEEQEQLPRAQYPHQRAYGSVATPRSAPPIIYEDEFLQGPRSASLSIPAPRPSIPAWPPSPVPSWSNSPPSPQNSGRVKSMLLKAKASIHFGHVDYSKKEKKDTEALRRMVQSGTTEARLGQNMV